MACFVADGFAVQAENRESLAWKGYAGANHRCITPPVLPYVLMVLEAVAEESQGRSEVHSRPSLIDPLMRED